MSFWNRFLQSNFVIRATHWEHWPFGVIHFPAIIYWLWLSIRARSLVFFSASNPGITMGGMFGESKYDVLKKIPEQYIPKTLLVRTPASASEVLRLMKENCLTFPIIFKPDIGERGYRVEKINNINEVEKYLNTVKANFIIQELVELPFEFGIFYTRFPNEEKGQVTSVVQKEMLTVTGNGSSTLEELILEKPRAKLQWKRLKNIYSYKLHEIVPVNETIELISIGNHCLGTKFINGNHLINESLSSTFDRISKNIDGFYFGRYDLRAASIEDLYMGKIKILELNGCGAEPGHIYDPSHSLPKAVNELLRHWKHIFVIAMMNQRMGVPFITHPEAYSLYKKFKAATR